MTLSFRMAVDADAAAIARLVNAAYGRESVEPGWTSERDLVAGPRTDAGRVRAQMRRPGSALLVAEDDGRTVGCVHVQQAAEREAEIGMLSVDVRGQSRGVGRALLERAEAHARDRMGAQVAVLHVISVRDELLAWYERRGYTRTGRLAPFVSGGPGRAKQDALQFERLEKRILA